MRCFEDGVDGLHTAMGFFEQSVSEREEREL